MKSYRRLRKHLGTGRAGTVHKMADAGYSMNICLRRPLSRLRRTWDAFRNISMSDAWATHAAGLV